jgi:hypothetical protein
MSHTPGPWKIGTPPPNGEQTIGNSQGLMVAVATTGFNVPTLANAQLIAAAPELLEALEELYHLIDDAHDGDRVFTFELAQKAKAAIAKARGQS